jgi:hypothetical protein
MNTSAEAARRIFKKLLSRQKVRSLVSRIFRSPGYRTPTTPGLLISRSYFQFLLSLGNRPFQTVSTVWRTAIERFARISDLTLR